MGGEEEMPRRLEVLRFLRDAEGGMRQAAMIPTDIMAELMRLADEIGAYAERLRAELVDDGLITEPTSGEERRPSSAPLDLGDLL